MPQPSEDEDEEVPRMRGNHLLTHGSVGFFCKCRRMGNRDAPSPALPRNSTRLDKIHPTVPKYLTGWQNWSLFRSYNILGYFQLVKFILCVSAEAFHMMTYHFLFEFNSKYEKGTCVAHHRVIFDPRALLPLGQRAECGRNH